MELMEYQIVDHANLRGRRAVDRFEVRRRPAADTTGHFDHVDSFPFIENAMECIEAHKAAKAHSSIVHSEVF